MPPYGRRRRFLEHTGENRENGAEMCFRREPTDRLAAPLSHWSLWGLVRRVCDWLGWGIDIGIVTLWGVAGI
jgi:hypothetical protein